MAYFINWPRFWFERKDDDAERVRLDRGFLVDPEGEYGKYLSPELHRLERLSDIGFLALLGEPGSGKSTDVRATAQFAVASSDSAGFTRVYCDLREQSSFYQMVEWLEAQPGVRNWRRGESEVAIFLDSLDEAPFSRAAAQLGEWVASNRNPGLKVRCACRSLAWSRDLERTFAATTASIGVESRVFELAPLRADDVLRAVGPESGPLFLQQVYKLDLVERHAITFG